MTMTTSLTDEASRNHVWDVLRKITDRVDDGDASHVQLIIKLVLHQDQASSIADAAREAGANPTITPID